VEGEGEVGSGGAFVVVIKHEILKHRHDVSIIMGILFFYVFLCETV
jgi:hypothetical protein